MWRCVQCHKNEIGVGARPVHCYLGTAVAEACDERPEDQFGRHGR